MVSVKQKDRCIQTEDNKKDKIIQTLSDDSLSKQIDVRDRKICELEKSLDTLNKQSKKAAKLEKELQETKKSCQKQSRELETLKSHKKRVKGWI